ncbi:MAG TPA: GTPase domain-containing protein [Tepidisphaeraceae bacterium]|nr:GTPase domain-containing protein [Tepidisphaeraceae bacterium]
MIQEYRQLVDEISQQVGIERPALLEEGAPVLDAAALRQDLPMYLVGLIGGKDVGKSSLVNALVGQEISERTSYGPGTEIVVAYAHETQAAALRALLDREVRGQYRIVTHTIAWLQRQVLVDLPDIDSHYAQHVEVTRRMLRHMLYPIWLQSVEKYADRRPRELLALVAAGNAPENFVFCLNKVDQIMRREGESAARELAEDYAGRIAEQLKLPERPRVWLISATHPQEYDLPALREMLTRQKSEEVVGLSRRSAERQQGVSLARWVEQLGLGQRLAALDRLANVAEEELAARVSVPLIDTAIPQLLDDPAYRLALGDEVMQQRANRWPIVNVLHVLLGPWLSMARLRLPVQQQKGLAGAEELVGVHLRELWAARAPGRETDAAGGQSVAGLVQSTFAYLQQSSPVVSRLYEQRKLWEPAAADMAEMDLHRRLAATIDRQRAVIRSWLSSRGVVGALFRIVLTIGAVIWFPFAQPILEAWMKGIGQMTLLVVQVLGVSYLLKNVGFLAVYFVVLWLVLKWDTQRRVDRWLGRWKSGQSLDPTLSLAGQVVEWNNALLEPIREARTKMTALVQRAEKLRDELEQSAAA